MKRFNIPKASDKLFKLPLKIRLPYSAKKSAEQLMTMRKHGFTGHISDNVERRHSKQDRRQLDVLTPVQNKRQYPGPDRRQINQASA
jgi:hypothetical protein